MDQTSKVKQEIIVLISQNFGERLGKTFEEINTDQTLPIFVNCAMSILEDYLGKNKAKGELQAILQRHRLWGILE